MCPPWIEGAHMGAPLQEGALLTSERNLVSKDDFCHSERSEESLFYSVCQKFFPILDIHKSPLTPL